MKNGFGGFGFVVCGTNVYSATKRIVVNDSFVELLFTQEIATVMVYNPQLNRSSRVQNNCGTKTMPSCVASIF